MQYIRDMTLQAEANRADLRIYPWGGGDSLELLLADAVSAGFPSPAQDYQEGRIDLNRELVRRPEATFCVVARGQSMVDANLFDGDILVVDRSLTAQSGSIAVCILDGEFLVKRYTLEKSGVVLWPANPAFHPIRIQPDQDFQVWGVVTWILHKADKK